MTLTFNRPIPYNNEYGFVVSEVVAFYSGFETIIGYIIKSENNYKRVWVFA